MEWFEDLLFGVKMKTVSIVLYQKDLLYKLVRLAKKYNIPTHKFRLVYVGSEGAGQVGYCRFEYEIEQGD